MVGLAIIHYTVRMLNIGGYWTIIILLYPTTMATDSIIYISGGTKSHARRVQYQQEVVVFNYNTISYNARSVLLPWQRGIK